jgi:hypothetical protein
MDKRLCLIHTRPGRLWPHTFYCKMGTRPLSRGKTAGLTTHPRLRPRWRLNRAAPQLSLCVCMLQGTYTFYFQASIALFTKTTKHTLQSVFIRSVAYTWQLVSVGRKILRNYYWRRRTNHCLQVQITVLPKLIVIQKLLKVKFTLE